MRSEPRLQVRPCLQGTLPETGLEPVQAQCPGDFKSPVSTISTTPASVLRKYYTHGSVVVNAAARCGARGDGAVSVECISVEPNGFTVRAFFPMIEPTGVFRAAIRIKFECHASSLELSACRE